MDFKNLLEKFASMPNLTNALGSQPQQTNGFERPNVCMYPNDFSSEQNFIQTQSEPLNQNSDNVQKPLMQNISSLLPLLSLFTGGNKGGVKQLLSKATSLSPQLAQLSPLLEMIDKPEVEKPKTPPIDSYKRIDN